MVSIRHSPKNGSRLLNHRVWHGDRYTCGGAGVKSVLRLFDELVKCDEEGVLKGVREVIEGK